MPSLAELGQKVKAKYPGQYDHLNDTDLGQRVTDKYPEYRSQFSDVPKAPIPPGLTGPKQGEENSVGGSGNEPGLPAIVNQGISQLGRAIPSFANSWKRGVSNVLEGGAKMASPLAIPALAAAPVTTLAATAMGMGAQKGGAAIARHLGASPDTERLVGDVSGLVAGPLAAKATSAGVRSVAPSLSESALGVRAGDRQFGARPGVAALSDTRGYSPGAISRSAGERIGDLTPVLNKTVAMGSPVDLTPPRSIVSGARALAASQGDLSAYNDLAPIGESLMRNRVTGEEYSNPTPAQTALDLRRGFGREQAHFNRQPGRTDLATKTARGAYGQLTNSIHESAPGSAELDERIQGLIPVRDRADLKSRSADGIERAMDRVSRPTGGLFPMIFGFSKGGLTGAGEALGAQEMLSSPTFKMALARSLWRGVGGERLTVPGLPETPAPRALLGRGPLITPPPPDTSFVRGVPGMTAPPNPARALPPATTRFAGPVPDGSYVRGVPAHQPFRVGFSQKALPPATTQTRGNPEIGSQYGDVLFDPIDPTRKR